MRSLLIAFLFACGSSQPAPAPAAAAAPPPPPAPDAHVDDAGDHAVAKLSELADAMCACTNRACAQKVSDDMAKWSAAQPADLKLSDAQETQATAQGQRLGDCMSAASKKK